MGHYSLEILSKDKETVEEALFMLPEESKKTERVLLKIHRQFGHPRED